jgi:hypothetical protein
VTIPYKRIAMECIDPLIAGRTIREPADQAQGEAGETDALLPFLHTILHELTSVF